MWLICAASHWLQYDESERRREMAKNSLERYTHYYERWAANQSVSYWVQEKLPEQSIVFYISSKKDFQSILKKNFSGFLISSRYAVEAKGIRRSAEFAKRQGI